LPFTRTVASTGSSSSDKEAETEAEAEDEDEATEEPMLECRTESSTRISELDEGTSSMGAKLESARLMELVL
jgi:hypothetical protein